MSHLVHHYQSKKTENRCGKDSKKQKKISASSASSHMFCVSCECIIMHVQWLARLARYQLPREMDLVNYVRILPLFIAK